MQRLALARVATLWVLGHLDQLGLVLGLDLVDGHRPQEGAPQEGHGDGVGVVAELRDGAARHALIFGHDPRDEDVLQVEEGPVHGPADELVDSRPGHQVGRARGKGRVGGLIILLGRDEVLKMEC